MLKEMTARIIMAPSRIINVTSLLASLPSKPSFSSATRKQDRTNMKIVAAKRAFKTRKKKSVDNVPARG